jgi:hypothetical protein
VLPGDAEHLQPRGLRLPGLRAPTGARLRAAVSVLAAEGGPWAVADLSLGAWRSHAVAAEWEAQLGLPPATVSTRTGPTREMHSYAEIVGAGVDAESTGSRSVLDAVERAERMARAVRGQRAVLLVVAPRFGAGWEEENEHFLRALCARLDPADRVVLVASGGEEPVLPEGWSVAWEEAPAAESSGASPASAAVLLPGVFFPNVAATIEGVGGVTVPLPGGLLLVGPEHRRDPDACGRLEYDRLAEALQGNEELYAWAQYHGNNLYLDTEFVAAQAWKHFAAGSPGIGLRLLMRCIDLARTPLERARWQAQAQGMCISLMRFEEAASFVAPPPSVPARLRGFLAQAKGWGLVMGKKPEGAGPFLEEAHQLLMQDAGARESLYLLNITALYRFKQGDLDGALSLEKRIEREAAALRDGEGRPARDYRLEYVNFINQARVYRHRGELDESARYYERAFDTTRGLRSDGDIVYVNVCRAMSGARQRRPETALLAWVRAALCWVASPAPEAMSPRVLRAIAPEVDRHSPDLVERVCAALVRHLDSAWAQARGDTHSPGTRAREVLPVAVRADDLWEEQGLTFAAGAPGWCVLRTRAVPRELYPTPAHRRLRAWLASWVEHEMGEPLQLEGFAVDTGLGDDIPAALPSFVEMCMRLGVPSGRFGLVPVELEGPRRRVLEQSYLLELAPGLAALSLDEPPRLASFKRCRSSRPLEDGEAALLRRIAANGPTCVAELGAGEELAAVLALARRLEQARILRIRLTEHACDSAGIR